VSRGNLFGSSANGSICRNASLITTATTTIATSPKIEYSEKQRLEQSMLLHAKNRGETVSDMLLWNPIKGM
jgi:hypothetical protein